MSINIEDFSLQGTRLVGILIWQWNYRLSTLLRLNLVHGEQHRYRGYAWVFFISLVSSCCTEWRYPSSKEWGWSRLIIYVIYFQLHICFRAICFLHQAQIIFIFIWLDGTLVVSSETMSGSPMYNNGQVWKKTYFWSAVVKLAIPNECLLRAPWPNAIYDKLRAKQTEYNKALQSAFGSVSGWTESTNHAFLKTAPCLFMILAYPDGFQQTTTVLISVFKNFHKFFCCMGRYFCKASFLPRDKLIFASWQSVHLSRTLLPSYIFCSERSLGFHTTSFCKLPFDWSLVLCWAFELSNAKLPERCKCDDYGSVVFLSHLYSFLLFDSCCNTYGYSFLGFRSTSQGTDRNVFHRPGSKVFWY